MLFSIKCSDQPIIATMLRNQGLVGLSVYNSILLLISFHSYQLALLFGQKSFRDKSLVSLLILRRIVLVLLIVAILKLPINLTILAILIIDTW